MANDLLVYSSRADLISAATLIDALGRAGWRAAVAPRYVWIGGAREQRPGALGDPLYGWRDGDDAAILALIAKLPDDVASARTSARQQLAQLPHVVRCEVSGVPFEFEPGELDDDAELTGEQRARLASTRAQYHVRDQGELARPVWQALAALTDGIMLDAGAGAWTLPPRA